MRIAVLADIHGNLAALDAVLADIAREPLDGVVHLGDMLSGPLQPAATADRLIALGGPMIRGNHERQLLTLPRQDMGASDRHAAECLTEAHRAWLASLPETLRLAPDILACHGTPASDLAYLLHTLEGDCAREASEHEIAARLGDTAAHLVLCGHTHLPRAVRLGDGRLVVNPGSVGLQAYHDDEPRPHEMEAGTPDARYAVCTRDASGVWTAELRTVRYDWSAAARIAADRGRPDWAIGLATGRMRA